MRMDGTRFAEAPREPSIKQQRGPATIPATGSDGTLIKRVQPNARHRNTRARRMKRGRSERHRELPRREKVINGAIVNSPECTQCLFSTARTGPKSASGGADVSSASRGQAVSYARRRIPAAALPFLAQGALLVIGMCAPPPFDQTLASLPPILGAVRMTGRSDIRDRRCCRSGARS